MTPEICKLIFHTMEFCNHERQATRDIMIREQARYIEAKTLNESLSFGCSPVTQQKTLSVLESSQILIETSFRTAKFLYWIHVHRVKQISLCLSQTIVLYRSQKYV